MYLFTDNFVVLIFTMYYVIKSVNSSSRNWDT